MPNHRYLRHTLAAEAVSASPQVAESFLQVWTPETWIWTRWTLDPELMQPRPPGPAYTNYLYHLKVSVTHVLSDPQLHPPRVAEAQEKILSVNLIYPSWKDSFSPAAFSFPNFPSLLMDMDGPIILLLVITSNWYRPPFYGRNLLLECH